MTINVIDAARDRAPFATDSERTLLLLLASQGARGIRTQEEAAIDEEDYWTQAEEANAIDPM